MGILKNEKYVFAIFASLIEKVGEWSTFLGLVIMWTEYRESVIRRVLSISSHHMLDISRYEISMK